MAGRLTLIQYTSDNGTDYRVVQDLSNSTAAGNVHATSTTDYPGNYRPRYVLARHPTTGRERKIVIGDPSNAMWLGGTTTISLPDFDATMAPTTYVIQGRIGERRLAPKAT